MFVTHNQGLAKFCAALEAQFKLSPKMAYDKFAATAYTVDDVKNNRSIAEYVMNVKAAAAGAMLYNGDDGVVLHAWTHLEYALRQTVDEPAEGTTIAQFIATLQSKKPNWMDRFTKIVPQSQRPTQRSQYNPRPGFGRGYQSNWNETAGGYGSRPYAGGNDRRACWYVGCVVSCISCSGHNLCY